VLLLALAVVAVAAPARAQEDDRMTRSRLHLAQEYQREGRFQEALELYEEVVASFPGDGRALRGLKTCLLELKRYDELLAIVEKELQETPDQPALLEELGTVAVRKGDREAAARWWRRIVEVQQGSRSAYTFVADLMARNRMLDEALSVYAEADSVHPGRFIRQKASLHEQRFEFDEATAGYLDYLEGSPTGLSYVEGRLLRIGEAEEGLGPVIQRVERRLERSRGGNTGGLETLDVTYRKLLGDLYLEAGDHEHARLQYFKLVDEAPNQYASLLVFGKRCQTDGKHDVAIRVFERIVEEFPDARAVPSALAEIAGCQADLERWDDAIATFGRIVDEYPETDFAYAARFQTGRLLREGKGQPAEAEAVFRELVPMRRGPWDEADPQFEVAECAVWQRDLERARGIFAAIGARDFAEPTRERALFEEARTLYYAKDFALADSLFKRVAEEFPKGDHVNDALGFSILVNTNPDPAEVIGPYADARLAVRIRRPQEAIDTLQTLVREHSDASIADEALLLLGHAHRANADFPAALAVLLRAVSEAQVPDLAADARLLRAEILARDLNDVPSALAEYEELLVAFPETLAADRARDLSAELTRMLP
jgi:tetratricopeptide (TPR) repeat protein